MKMNKRYSITPQMREYDKIGQIWLPYLMYFHEPNYSSSVLNTDSRGFRITYKGPDRIQDFAIADKYPVCLLVGGSFAFGVGATNDRRTIPSILNSITDYLWLNFGGRAFSSTQEFLSFLFYHQQIKNIKKVVILSGLNNLTLYRLSQHYSKELGSFFFWNQYNQKMNTKALPMDRRVAKWLLYPIFGNKIDYSRVSKEELARYIFNGKERKGLINKKVANVVRKEPDCNSRKEELLHVLRRDILNWKLITESLGIELYYILQPLANWIDKKTLKKEELLFAELDKHPQNLWKVLKDDMGRDQYAWFLENIRGICETNVIPFFDMNEAISKMQLHDTWFYVDRAHVTDEGYQIIAEILKEQVIGR